MQSPLRPYLHARLPDAISLLPGFAPSDLPSHARFYACTERTQASWERRSCVLLILLAPRRAASEEKETPSATNFFIIIHWYSYFILTTNIISNWLFLFYKRVQFSHFTKFILYFEWYFSRLTIKCACLLAIYIRYTLYTVNMRRDLDIATLFLISFFPWCLLNHLLFILYAQLL